MNYTRNNAWNNGGSFNNPDLLWYAKAVGVMQSRKLNDPGSWWFFAAIHGEYIGQTGFPGWGSIPGPPAVPTTPLPAQSVQDMFWNQCQHQSWFFAPWHRGYLIALEAFLRQIIIGLNGPANWALPYWNYFGPNGENKIPPAFTVTTLPDGSPNPLYVKLRYGPQNNGNVYIAMPPVNAACMTNTVYTGSNAATPRPGFGGPATGFSHGGSTSGNLENNPHNLVHVQVGGFISNSNYGLMSDPGIAALDPIFYLHHCNIDRMWAAWNARGNSNPAQANWLNGPQAIGQRAFAMPMPGGTTWTYAPKDVNSLTQLNYSYANLQEGLPQQQVNALHQRMIKLDRKDMDIMNEQAGGSGGELIGANKESLRLTGKGTTTSVICESAGWKKVNESFMKSSANAIPDQVYLQIENVKGNLDANILEVKVNEKHVGYVSLFGMRKSSDPTGHHGGAGLTFLLEITDVVDDLHMKNQLNVENLQVSIVPANEIPSDEQITVGRVSLYREAVQ